VFLISVLMIVIPQSYIIRNLNNRIENEQTQIDDLDKDRKEFDQRSKELGRRLIQMRTAAEISHSINLVLDPRILLNQVVDIIRERFDLYYVGIFLLDDQEDYAILKAGTGDAGRQMINDGHKLPIGNSSMVGWAIAHHQPRISLDTDDETVLFTNPLLPKTRSEMALPLMSGEQIFGAVSIQSSRQNAFDEDDIAVLQGVVDSLAIALNNAQLFQMEEEHLKEIQNLNRQYLSNAWENIAKNPEISVVDYLNDQIAGSDDDISPINIPIELREQVIGKISLQLGVNTLSSDDLAFVNQITTQAALALENVRLQEETQRRANHDRLVTEIINRARISTDVDTILRITLSELGKSMQASEGLIHLDIPEVNVSSQHDGSDL